MTTLNRYTKTIIEFRYKRRNIEKSLLVQQQLLQLDVPQQVWDLYLAAPPTAAEPPAPPANGHKPPTGAYVVEMDEASEQHGEDYC